MNVGLAFVAISEKLNTQAHYQMVRVVGRFNLSKCQLFVKTLVFFCFWYKLIIKIYQQIQMFFDDNSATLNSDEHVMIQASLKNLERILEWNTAYLGDVMWYFVQNHQ